MTAKKARILYILHAYNNRGGTEQHVKDLAAGLKNTFDIYICYPEQNKLFLHTPWGQKSAFDWPQVSFPIVPYDIPEATLALAKVIKISKPDLVHIQHCMHWPLSVLDQLAREKLPIVYSLHDYFSITPWFTLEGVGNPEECFTKEYASTYFKADVSRYLQNRRALFKKSFGAVSKFVSPSQFTANIHREIYGIEAQVIAHGIQKFNSLPKQNNAGRIVFGFVGSLLRQKGWDVLLAAFLETYKRYPQIELHYYGGNAPENRSWPGVYFHGPYDQAQLPSILSSIDIGIIPSIFRESFSLILSELWLAGCPVIVSEIGALGDRVKDRVDGLKCIPGNVGSFASALEWCIQNPLHQWHITSPRLLPEMLAEYESLYQNLLN